MAIRVESCMKLEETHIRLPKVHHQMPEVLPTKLGVDPDILTWVLVFYMSLTSSSYSDLYMKILSYCDNMH
jgi:hypothetical protein